VSSYEDVKRVALDDATFSSARSVTVPAKPAGFRPSLPIELDPPRFVEFRRALVPCFTPAAARSVEPTIGRFAPDRNLTFGIGIHRCLGAHLAAVELRQALGALLSSGSGFQVDRDRASFAESAGVVRGHASIPLTFSNPPSA
jgi:cytochrome P450